METPTLAGAGAHDDQATFDSNLINDDAQKVSSAQASGATPGAWEHAIEWLGLGDRLLPVVSDPAVAISPDSAITEFTRGKAPSTINRSGLLVGITKWTTHRSTDVELTRWSQDPRLGICLRLEGFGVLDVDIDDVAAANAARQIVEDVLGFPLPARSRQNCGRMALLFRHDTPIAKRVHPTPAGKIELLGAAQHFVIDGRHNKSGVRYQWDGAGPAGLPNYIPSLTPAQLAAVLDALGFEQQATEDRPHAVASGPVTDEQIADLRAALRHLAAAGHGDGNDEWHRNLAALRSIGDEGLPLAVEYSQNCANFNPGETERKWPGIGADRTGFKAIFKRAMSSGWINPRQAVPNTAEGFQDMPVSDGPAYDPYDDLGDHSDTGNANLLRKFANGDMRFVVERNCWMWWTGDHWQVDDTGSLAQALALRVGKFYLGKAQSMARRAGDATLDPAEQKKLSKVAEALKAWATTCRNKTSITNMLTIASRDARMVIRTADLDRDPWLFGVANGVVDLRTGELRAAGRDDLVTKRSASVFRLGATAYRWRQFIDEITGLPVEGNPGTYKKRPRLAAYVQRMCGYLMTGGTAEHKMFIPHGVGSNGKNILLDIVQEVMGDYAVTIPPEALMATRHDGDAEKPSSVAATLAGARAAISSESKEGQRLDVALVKRHTGGGFMNARLMRENSFRFAISHKLVLMTNHRPTLDHMDEAIRGRLHMIPFDRVWNRPGHPDRDPTLPDGDKGLMDALRTESEGVLAWLVEGAELYHRDGLEPPAEVTKATRDYFATEDSFGRWIETMEPCDPKVGTRATDLFNNFNAHCISHARRPSIATQTAFSLELKKRGTAHKTMASGTFYGLTYGGLVGSGGLF